MSQLQNHVCEHCGKGFENRKLLLNHLTIHTSIPSTCGKCGKSFSTKVKVQRNVKNVHEKKDDTAISCTECDQSFDQKINLLNHLVDIHEKKKQDCDICQKSYAIRYLKSHIILCRARYLKNVQDHYVNKSKPSDSKQCSKCNKKFGNNDRYEAHVENCNGINNYCDICNKTLKSSLTRHT